MVCNFLARGQLQPRAGSTIGAVVGAPKCGAKWDGSGNAEMDRARVSNFTKTKFPEQRFMMFAYAGRIAGTRGRKL